MRAGMKGLRRYIATGETSKHRFFVFLDERVLPDHKIYAITADDGFILGVLSSSIHAKWALAAGGRLGVGNDPTWTNTTCFLKFPFPDPSSGVRQRIAELGEALDAHRKDRRAAHLDITITSMYNVLEKLRGGEALDPKDAAVHQKALVSVLKKLHEDLDAAVFEAYGWPADLTDEQILERLVALNAERAEEEKQGHIRWLRPDFQNPAAQPAAVQTTVPGVDQEANEQPTPTTTVSKPWPRKPPQQILAVRDLLATARGLLSLERVAGAFTDAKPDEVESVVDSLAALGLVVVFPSENGPLYKSVTAARPAAASTTAETQA